MIRKLQNMVVIIIFFFCTARITESSVHSTLQYQSPFKGIKVVEQNINRTGLYAK